MKNLNIELQDQADLIIRSGRRCFVIAKGEMQDVCNASDYEARKRSGWTYVGESFDGETY